MPSLQDLIHRLEVGAGTRYLKYGLLTLALVGAMFIYDWRAYKNMSTQEAMDAAQLGRNISEGKGYTTLFIRPLSVYLVKKAKGETVVSPLGQESDAGQLKDMHPDLANPPVYPVVLAALMKVLPFKYQVDVLHPFWSIPSARPTAESPRQFYRYQPDFLITLFNQLLFFVALALAFFLTRRLFDPTVALVSTILLLGTELFWRFSVSGLSTMLLLVIFLALLWCVALFENSAREGTWGQTGLFGLTVAAGFLVGLGALTRYAFGWLIIPVLLFVLLFGGRQRVVLAGLALATCLIVLGPWLARNVNVSRAPFGTATYAVLVATDDAFGESKLDRSLQPDFKRANFSGIWRKLLSNTRQIVQNDIPRLGGSWLTSFFLVGLLVGFRNPTLSRLRYFLLFCLVTLIAVQALGRTQLSDDSPEINSENLLVLLGPGVLIFGVSLFFLLLERIELPIRQLRYAIIGLFSVVACLPMIFTFLPPRNSPVAYPPYYPPVIQQTANWMKEKELMMSDIPWAVAWYGKRQCMWLTLNAQSDFFAVNDYQKPIKALYLTPQTMDSRFLSQWIRPGEFSWGSFILDSMIKREIPPTFPLRKAPAGFLPEQLFLTDWDRWKKPAS